MASLKLVQYNYNPKPSALLNSFFMSTVKVAGKTLVSVASKLKVEDSEKWRPSDHLRFIVIVWVLRVLTDHFPFPMNLSPHYLLNSFSTIGSSFPLALKSSSTTWSTSSPSMDLI